MCYINHIDFFSIHDNVCAQNILKRICLGFVLVCIRAGIITWAFPLWEKFFYFIIIANRSNKFNSLNKSVRMKVVKIKEIVICSSDEKTFSSPYRAKSTGKTLSSVGWLKLDFDLSIFRLKITKISCKKNFLQASACNFI